ncbi:MAG TPA: heat-inducible transcriptional repressor HrcA [Acidobacteriota bacterium]|nr:heat-inducible transcriptional repressor HrcA [Acidobacteriota bacterium]
MPADDEKSLSERTREILRWAITTFVATGKPVGSRSIARKSREHISAATVRNIMADLEGMGYLRQPHASAGRIPTDKAYRFYVDYMLERHELSPRDRSEVDRSLTSEDSAEHLMARTSQVLSRVSNNVGIVISPPISQVALQHIQFIKLIENRILVILVSRSGIVQNRVIKAEEDYSQVDLDQAARYIVEHFRDRTLFEIRILILRLIQQEKNLYDNFMQRVIVLSTQTFSDVANQVESEVYLDGASNLIKTPEFSDINKMRALFVAIEQKSRLASLISQCIKGDNQEVRITIGAENALPGIEDCALITSCYMVDQKTHGSLGILGPTRMEYGRAISLVDYVARLFGRVLAAGN